MRSFITLCFTGYCYWAGNAAQMEEVRSAYKILVGSTEGKRPYGIPRRRQEDNIRIGS
jgi:hypothetical protein